MGCRKIAERTDQGAQVAEEVGISGGLGKGKEQDEENEDVARNGEAFSLFHRDFLKKTPKDLAAGDGDQHIEAQTLQNADDLGWRDAISSTPHKQR